MRRSMFRVISTLLAAPIVLIAHAAVAAPASGACGDFSYLTDGSCEVLFSGGCQASCTPLSFTAVCDAKCTISLDASCSASCESDCTGQCTVDPGRFDCEASCNTSCEAGCTTQCAEDAACVTTCQGQCSGQCTAGCTVEAPSASCDLRCKASCEASCNVEANADCYGTCSADLQGGCDIQCQDPDGALFCDGQYVNISSGFDNCMAFIKDLSVNGSCTGNTCSATVKCSAAPSPGSDRSPLGAAGVAGMVMAVGLMASRRRRNS